MITFRKLLSKKQATRSKSQPILLICKRIRTRNRMNLKWMPSISWHEWFGRNSELIDSAFVTKIKKEKTNTHHLNGWWQQQRSLFRINRVQYHPFDVCLCHEWSALEKVKVYRTNPLQWEMIAYCVARFAINEYIFQFLLLVDGWVIGDLHDNFQCVIKIIQSNPIQSILRADNFVANIQRTFCVCVFECKATHKLDN